MELNQFVNLVKEELMKNDEVAVRVVVDKINHPQSKFQIKSSGEYQVEVTYPLPNGDSNECLFNTTQLGAKMVAKSLAKKFIILTSRNLPG